MLNMNQIDTASSAWVNTDEKIRKVGDEQHPAYIIETPYFQYNGDGIDLRVYPQLDGRIKLTDNAMTAFELKFLNLKVGHDSQLDLHIKQIISGTSVKIGTDGELYCLVSHIADVSHAKHELMQVVLAVGGLGPI